MKKYLILLSLLLSLNVFAADKNEYYKVIDKTYKNKNYSDGIKALERAVKEFPEEANFHSNLIFMYCHSKRFSDAVKYGSSVINKFPDNQYINESYRWGLVGLGWDEFNAKKYPEALNIFKTAFDRYPEDKDVLNGYGCSLREMKKYENAITVLEKGYGKYPDDKYLKENLSWSYFYLSDEMIKKGNLQEGEIFLKKFFATGNRNKPDTWSGFLYKCSTLKIYDEGISVLKEAEKSFKDNEEIYKSGYWLYWNSVNDKKNSGDYTGMISSLKELCRYASKKEVMHESGISYHHMAVSIAHIDIFEAAERICPYWKKFSGDEKERSYRLLEVLKKDTPAELRFAVYNLNGMILYREDRIEEAHSKLEESYREALKLPFAEKLKYTEPVYITMPLKGFIDSSNVESTKYITHMGLNRNCYDFFGADKNGNQLKNGIDPYKSKLSDWYGFGIPVYSPIDGIVHEMENTNNDDPPYPKTMARGNYIYIKAADGSIYNFYHLKKGSVRLRKGDRVKKGAQIAQLGNSASTSPHLHFGVYSADWIVSRPVFFVNYSSVKEGVKEFKESGQPGKNKESYELIEVK